MKGRLQIGLNEPEAKLEGLDKLCLRTQLSVFETYSRVRQRSMNSQERLSQETTHYATAAETSLRPLACLKSITKVLSTTWCMAGRNGILAKRTKLPRATLKSANFLLELLELLLQSHVLLGHLFVFLFPLVALLLQSLHFALVVAGLDVGLSEPASLKSAFGINKGAASQANMP